MDLSRSFLREVSGEERAQHLDDLNHQSSSFVRIIVSELSSAIRELFQPFQTLDVQDPHICRAVSSRKVNDCRKYLSWKEEEQERRLLHQHHLPCKPHRGNLNTLLFLANFQP